MNQQKSILLFFIVLFLNSCSGLNEQDEWEATEEFPGGNATTEDLSINAFSHAVPTLTSEEEFQFVTGNAFFKRNWVTAPASTEDLDGLGPLFNARSCSSCHMFDGRAEPPSSKQKDKAGLLFRLSVKEYNGVEWEINDDPNYGGQFNTDAILGVNSEGDFEIHYSEVKGKYPDGTAYSLRKPVYNFKNLKYGDMHDSVLVSPRIAPQIVGLGLLEAIEGEDLYAIEDPDDQNGDGISGRLNYIYDREEDSLAIGRFGWKANQPNVKQQVASAFAGDIGINSRLFPNQPCTDSQQDCNEVMHGGEFELSDDILQRVTLYSQTLAVPKRRNFKSENVLIGKKLFADVGCDDCHRAKFKTGEHPTIKALSNQVIYPYTDLLLHDMGEGLADHRPDGKANGSEWRTPPLWGIGLIKTVNGHSTLLHDGRARNVEEAILWHNGEGKNSREAFMDLSALERENLITFVNSL